MRSSTRSSSFCIARAHSSLFGPLPPCRRCPTPGRCRPPAGTESDPGTLGQRLNVDRNVDRNVTTVD
jgi:hypothetical protein